MKKSIVLYILLLIVVIFTVLFATGRENFSDSSNSSDALDVSHAFDDTGALDISNVLDASDAPKKLLETQPAKKSFSFFNWFWN